MAEHLARKAQAKRLFFNMSQQTLAEKSGVSYGSIKKFERTGHISLDSLLKIALVLDALLEFENLFDCPRPTTFDDLMHQKTRKRGRK